MERIILGAITSQMKHVIGKSQHRFINGKSCLTNLVAFYDKVTCSVEVGRAVDIVYLEFSKAFDMVSHSLLLEKWMHYGLDKWFMWWGSILRPTLFSIFISDLDDGIKRTLMKFADDPKLSGEADTSERRATLQEDLDRLEEWANKNLMQFNKDKGKVLHLGKHNPGVQHRLGPTQLGSSSVERDPGVLVDNQLNMSERRAAVAKKANRMLGCTNEGITSRDKEAIIPFYSALATPGILSPLRKKDVDRLERVQGRATKMLKGLGSLPYEERLRELGLFSLEKRRLRGDLITMFQYLKGGYKEDGDSLFTRSHMEKTRGNGYKLLLGRSRLDTRGKFVTMRTISLGIISPGNGESKAYLFMGPYTYRLVKELHQGERLNNPSSLSRSSSDLCSRPSTSFVALLWTRSSTSMSLL
ncbi:LOW QUALITY PROTEIN: hypothetical protein QYF61_020740 [Mycteria americana]|uniref:Reverse transcriptase domain-containing protein n=1 Tax=Mycteria americana TaxID=33587 RepID=A0AAN7SLM3_MYCAM|nr:LOW QUALITY PROTEIN: hypothetical protein QYF61_020740 [Mycteria americana]